MRAYAILIAIAMTHLAGWSPVWATSGDEATLRHLKTVLWPQAYRTQDTDLLGQILHPTFEMIDNEGRRSDRKSEIEFVSKHAWTPSNFSYTIERLEIYDGKFAVVDGTGATDTYKYKSSNYLIKENGHWRAIGSHVSGYKEK
ncbi:nuclear transport factor 2 family protein [Kordiimonas lipolytica]|uniref:Nuclear transport factor 2 family protein n=1 Tax=Kordiimonas lipolytica TaxID=1662421 RepID=A0ABV8U890_9PROT|nr:nuclear transport factor 2 family protein [Kordiimonas lipolytica]